MKFALSLIISLWLPFAVFGQWNGEVVEVLEGDHLKVKKASGIEVDVRLYGIACPKSGQPFGDQASIKTANKLIRRKVKVKTVETGLYDRIIGKVYHRSILINRWLVQKGLAWVFDKYCQKPICKQWKKIQKRKQASKTGLWQQKNPTPPWQYP